MNFWQTDTIRLRGIEPSDAALFFEWNQDSERVRYLDFTWPLVSLASVTEWVEQQAKKRLEGDAFHNVPCRPLCLWTGNGERSPGLCSGVVDRSVDDRGSRYHRSSAGMEGQYSGVDRPDRFYPGFRHVQLCPGAACRQSGEDRGYLAVNCNRPQSKRKNGASESKTSCA